jgi:hypothetical protein
MSADVQGTTRKSSLGLYALITAGMAVAVAFAALSLNSGGLPGTKDSPSAIVNGEPVTGKTGAD